LNLGHSKISPIIATFFNSAAICDFIGRDDVNGWFGGEIDRFHHQSIGIEVHTAPPSDPNQIDFDTPAWFWLSTDEFMGQDWPGIATTG
jgi:hypothetical protein